MEDVNQTTHQRCKQAVLAELIAAGCTPDNPIALYLVGPTLVAAGLPSSRLSARSTSSNTRGISNIPAATACA
jgi:hypothetical protein